MNCLWKVLALVSVLLIAGNVNALQAQVLDYEPFPAKAGSFLDLFVAVENNAKGDTKTVTVEFIPKDSIRLAFGEDAVKEIGIIPGNRSLIVKYRIEITEDAVDGENTFELKIKEGIELAETIDLSIEVENTFPEIEIGDIESEPRKILPDMDDVMLTVTLLNIGDSTAENMRTTLILPQGLGYSNSFSNLTLQGNLAANAQTDAVFFIDVPESSPGGKYNAELLVEYTLEDSVESKFIEKKLPFDIVIKPIPMFRVTEIETIPAELTAGDRGVLMTLTIENVGEAAGESVRIKVFQKSEQPFEFDRSFDFIAPKLNPGETGQGTLEFRVEEDAPVQKYLLEIEVKSFVDDTVRLESEVISLNVKNPRSSLPDPLILLGGALGVILIIAYFYRRRLRIIREKKQNMNLNKAMRSKRTVSKRRR